MDKTVENFCLIRIKIFNENHYLCRDKVPYGTNSNFFKFITMSTTRKTSYLGVKTVVTKAMGLTVSTLSYMVAYERKNV